MGLNKYSEPASLEDAIDTTEDATPETEQKTEDAPQTDAKSE